MSALGEALAIGPGARVLFTSRANGNLSSVGGLGAELGADTREALRVRLGLETIARGYQVHGTRVTRVRQAPPYSALAHTPQVRSDGQASALANVGLMVLSADCLPIAIAGSGAVAVVHAGWRGLAAGVIEEGVRALSELGGGEPLEAIVGPGAGPCCYEVGEEVHAAFGLESDGPANIDLRAIAHGRLHRAGVERVGDVELCTVCDERCFSHRREAGLAGRQGAIAWLS